jgi:hypothetical protein
MLLGESPADAALLRVAQNKVPVKEYFLDISAFKSTFNIQD